MRRGSPLAFCYFLCLNLGIADVRGFMEETPYRQILEWQEYFRLEPFGEPRADLRVAHAAAQLSAMWAGKGAKIKVSDFMPDFARPASPARAADPVKEWEAAKARARIFAEAT